MIEMAVWDSAKAVAADRLRAAKGEGSNLQHELNVRQGWLQNLRDQVRYLSRFQRPGEANYGPSDRFCVSMHVMIRGHARCSFCG